MVRLVGYELGELVALAPACAFRLPMASFTAVAPVSMLLPWTGSQSSKGTLCLQAWCFDAGLLGQPGQIDRDELESCANN